MWAASCGRHKSPQLGAHFVVGCGSFATMCPNSPTTHHNTLWWILVSCGKLSSRRNQRGNPLPMQSSSTMLVQTAAMLVTGGLRCMLAFWQWMISVLPLPLAPQAVILILFAVTVPTQGTHKVHWYGDNYVLTGTYIGCFDATAPSWQVDYGWCSSPSNCTCPSNFSAVGYYDGDSRDMGNGYQYGYAKSTCYYLDGHPTVPDSTCIWLRPGSGFYNMTIGGSASIAVYLNPNYPTSAPGTETPPAASMALPISSASTMQAAAGLPPTSAQTATCTGDSASLEPNECAA